MKATPAWLHHRPKAWACALYVSLVFSALHPAVTLELDLSPRRVDLIGEGFDLAVRMVLTLRQQRELLETSNTLRRSIRLRNPYVDPMSLLQVELLRRWRESGDESLLPTLVASVDGIARGMQDAG